MTGNAPRVLLVPLLLLALGLLGACQRGGAAAPTPLPGFDSPGIPPSPTLDVIEGLPTVATDGPGLILTPGALPTAFPTNSAFEGRFTNLRFATSGSGDAQANFPAGTTDIYAIWDYDGMEPGARVERVWYHNGAQYLDVIEEWDFDKYGFSGTVRDVYHYNYEDGGVYPGSWKVELYLNGELQQTGEFTVGGP